MVDEGKPKTLSYRIIGAALEVHRALGPGLLERVYEDALCIELSDRNIQFERQKHIGVLYKGHDVGNYIADLIVEKRAIIEVKAVSRLAPVHTAQLINYLKICNLRAGLLINFNVPILKEGIKRIVL